MIEPPDASRRLSESRIRILDTKRNLSTVKTGLAIERSALGRRPAAIYRSIDPAQIGYTKSITYDFIPYNGRF
jgi:hypothetical protein